MFYKNLYSKVKKKDWDSGKSVGTMGGGTHGQNTSAVRYTPIEIKNCFDLVALGHLERQEHCVDLVIAGQSSFTSSCNFSFALQA